MSLYQSSDRIMTASEPPPVTITVVISSRVEAKMAMPNALQVQTRFSKSRLASNSAGRK